MKAITVPAEGRCLNSFFIQNHSLSCGRERSARRKSPEPPIDSEGIREAVRKTDANPQLVATARFLRGLIPGGEPETSEMPEPMQRLVQEVQPQGPSTLRE